jgi:hypothetical protein
MRTGTGVLLLFGATLGPGCSGPSLDLPENGAAAASVDFEPAASEGSVAPLFRAHVRNVPANAAPWLFRGELSDYYARALKHGDVPSALRERAVPLRFWREGTDCWLQPLDWLEPEAQYSLSFAGLGVVRVVQTEAVASERRVRRLFPPPGSRKHLVSVVCDVDAAALPSPFTLEPGGIAVRAAPGMAGQPSEGCVTLQVEAALTEAVVSPPRLGGALFEPSPWLPSGGSDETAHTCSEGEPFHGACLDVLDDRLRVTPVAQALFFALDEPQRLVLATRPGTRSLVLRGLSPGAELTLGGAVLASDGKLETFRTTVTTRSARRHLVLNEVLANPLGPEPDAEWLELVNDSERATSLADVWLEDSAGHVQLPDVELSPGELALVVSEGFRASGLDVPVPAGVRLLRVPSLGARGLSNGGEALLLVASEGVLSRFPLLAATHAGRSLARRTLDGADDDPADFAEHAGAGASPGAPNVLEKN